MLRSSTHYFAHRGLHGDRSLAPENSMAAFRRAVHAGYGIELDIQFSRDQQIVVFHDDTLRRVCGACGRVCDYDYEELKNFRLHSSPEHIPLLTDVLKEVNGKVPLIIEIKASGNRYSRQLAEQTAALLDEYPGEFAIESFHPLFLLWFRRHRPQFTRGQLATDFFRTNARGKRWQFWILELQLTNFVTRPDFIAWDIRHRHLPGFRFWKHFCTPVGWTLRDPAELPRLTRDFSYFIAERVRSSD